MTPARRAAFFVLLGLLLVVNLTAGGGGDGVAPIPGEGLRVLVIEETNDRASLKPEQLTALLSTVDGSMQAYCRSHAVADGFYLLDDDDDVSKMPRWVQDAWKRPRTGLPWIIASNGRRGFEGILPDNVVDRLKTLGGP